MKFGITCWDFFGVAVFKVFIYSCRNFSFVLYNILFFQPVHFGGKFGEESLESAEITCEYILPGHDQRKENRWKSLCWRWPIVIASVKKTKRSKRPGTSDVQRKHLWIAAHQKKRSKRGWRLRLLLVGMWHRCRCSSSLTFHSGYIRPLAWLPTPWTWMSYLP